jgi:hypothetical protein
MQFMQQPTPQVTSNDVERIVCRDFSAGEYDSVMAILNDYGTRDQPGGCARVQLAALKVANGNVSRLRARIELAKRDYRDTVVAAEYPAYNKLGFRMGKLPPEEQSRIIDSDWRQYEEWLKRP